MTLKLYKASDICDATGLQPYVLRSWEKEFPGIGVQKSQDSPRLYRQSDLEQVQRIKQLVFGEGLTLSGARRRLEAEQPHLDEGHQTAIDEVLDTLGADARSRLELVRTGLRSILEVLSKRAGAAELTALPRNGSSDDDRTEPETARGKSARNGSAAKGRASSSKASAAGRNGKAAAWSQSAKKGSSPKRGVAAKANGGKRRHA